MKKMIAAIAAFGFTVMMGSYANAEVYSSYEESTNWRLSQPVVSISGNEAAADAINSNIAEYVNALRSDFENGRYYACGGNYVVHYEDDNVLSISLYLLRQPYGANGNHNNSYDLVFDKNTGEQIPLENYVRITTSDLKQYMAYHSYSQNGRKINQISNYVYEHLNTIPQNYFLEGDGIVCIVFQPYELSSGAMGSCYVKLEPNYIDYLNRKNQW